MCKLQNHAGYIFREKLKFVGPICVLTDYTLEYFNMENTYRNFDVGKMLFTQLAKRSRCKLTNHSCGTLQGVR